VSKKWWVGLLVWWCATTAWAGEVTVSEAWARATAPGQDSAAVAMRIVSRKEARIVAVVSSFASSSEIHSMVHENGMMKMRALDAMLLPANQSVSLGADGNHLMLMGLKQPLKAGDTVTLTLVVQFADKHKENVKVEAEVKPLAAGHDHGSMGHEHHHHH